MLKFINSNRKLLSQKEAPIKVSIYVKGDRNSTAYYRIYQYLDNIEGITQKYNIMYPLWVQNNFMPVSRHSKVMQIVIYFIALSNVSLSLFYDLFKRPNVIIIHKRLISRYMPYYISFLLSLIKKRGTKIIWDFDDHLVEGREMTQKSFNFFSKIADQIIVTHQFLKSLISEQYIHKVNILPTTDGDMYKLRDLAILKSERLQSLQCEVRLVWVATSSNIPNLVPILPYLDKVASILMKTNRRLVLKVVCDKPLTYNAEYLSIENIKWTRNLAIKNMEESHIGIMPLNNTTYNKGKGGFKLVQYISFALPCIGSNVGYNKYVINNCGYLVENETEWITAILMLSDLEQWNMFSEKAYQHWINYFSYERNLDFWETCIKNYLNF